MRRGWESAKAAYLRAEAWETRGWLVPEAPKAQPLRPPKKPGSGSAPQLTPGLTKLPHSGRGSTSRPPTSPGWPLGRQRHRLAVPRAHQQRTHLTQYQETKTPEPGLEAGQHLSPQTRPQTAEELRQGRAAFFAEGLDLRGQALLSIGWDICRRDEKRRPAVVVHLGSCSPVARPTRPASVRPGQLTPALET